MIDVSLLDLLACPETQQSLYLADKELVSKANAMIEQRQLFNRNAVKLEQSVDELLIRDDKQYCYPVINNIPILLVEEGIECKRLY